MSFTIARRLTKLIGVSIFNTSRGMGSRLMTDFIRNYDTALLTLNSLQSNAQTLDKIRQQRGGCRMNLNSMTEMAALCTSIGVQVPCIHVAGTKGKGSVCAMTESTGAFQGERSGTCRVVAQDQCHIQPISCDMFSKYFWSTWDLLVKANIKPVEVTSTSAAPGLSDEVYKELPQMPPYFRFLTLMMLHMQMNENYDVVVLETGMGGRFDSTNVHPHPICTAITALGFDHTAILGNTIDKIAFQKAGIMKQGVPCYSEPQMDDAMAVLIRCSNSLSVPLTIVNPVESNVNIALSGDHQRINASLAIHLSRDFLYKTNRVWPDANTLPQYVYDGLARVSWPGRCQTINRGQVTYYIDGAHSPESIVAKRDVKHILLWNIAPNRDPADLLTHLRKCGLKFDGAIFSRNKTKNEIHDGKSVSVGVSTYSVLLDSDSDASWQKDQAKIYSSLFPEIGHVKYCTTPDLTVRDDVVVTETVDDAIRIIESQENCEIQVLATGSLYLVGGILQSFGWKIAE